MKKTGTHLMLWWTDICTIKRQCLWDWYWHNQGIEVAKRHPAKTATYSEIEKLYIIVMKDDFFKVGL